MQLTPPDPVTTARLRLRPLTPRDVDALLTYRGDADVCRYLPFEPMTREVLLSRLAGDLGRTRITDEGQAVTLGVEDRGTGRLVGDVVLFFRSREHAGGEIGYVFHPDARGRGYATEACAALLALAFDDFGLHRVVARLDSRNHASARLAARLGMRREAHFVRNELFKGVWSDELVFAMLVEEWATSPARAALGKH
ncbi:Protein N-acetyltransferase, RimJ/RimL family [Friedmanniella luteola]|uniref:Protein N-acetyltransferase, RimJ/RimL family n=1 Tax=Friedmanniella luteola TaxID=546871 RepID=A0A1H1XKA2_9ACTN|nr:GNAT family protein [Friedmanniella luteola]SDT09677.1 Protein N-acetyltransferase, RimJ/RimL family [Friedmanniella luteola]